MTRRCLLAGPILSALLVLSAAAADVWKPAPAPPASWQRDRLTDLAARRKAVAEQIGTNGILILYAAEPRNYAGDVDWPYRQENDFFYLTAIPQTGAALVMIPGAERTREILFLAPSNPLQESWTGHLLTPAEARQISGIETIWDARLLNSFLSALVPQAKTVFADPPAGGRAAQAPAMPLDVSGAFAPQIAGLAKGDIALSMLGGGRGERAEYRREAEIIHLLGALDPPLMVKNAAPMFNRLRAIKSPREIDLLQHAVDITAEAFQRVYALGAAGTPEYELQAQFEFTFLRRNGHWGYPCIVASGLNATTLHYESNKDVLKAGDLLLMDDAAEFDGYSADVTRTIPVSGKYSKEQAEIYRLVWAAQRAGIEALRPGKTPQQMNAAVNQVLREGLFQMGLISDVSSSAQLRVWLGHGVSHGIGLNVHDPSVGAGLDTFQPGMAVTMEPGLYIRLDALAGLAKTDENAKFIAAVKPAFEKYKGIGVRIEDDVLITDGAPRVMSAAVPSKLEDVEATIAQLRKAVKSSPLQ